jgi:hypothetical protein
MQGTTFLLNTRNRNKEKNEIACPQTNEHMLHQYKTGKIPKKYTSRRATDKFDFIHF